MPRPRSVKPVSSNNSLLSSDRQENGICLDGKETTMINLTGFGVLTFTPAPSTQEKSRPRPRAPTKRAFREQPSVPRPESETKKGEFDETSPSLKRLAEMGSKKLGNIGSEIDKKTSVPRKRRATGQRSILSTLPTQSLEHDSDDECFFSAESGSNDERSSSANSDSDS